MSAQPIEMPEPPKCDPQRERIVRVSVGEDGYPRVEPDQVTVNRLEDERVVWQADKGVNFTICFCEETPFESFHFHPCLPTSGSVRKAALGREYKYSVEVNGKLIDPKVVVYPPG